MKGDVGKCKICGKEFIKINHNSKVCSDECRRINIVMLNKRNDALRLAKEREERLKHPKMCKVCGKPVIAKGRSRYCSDKCYEEGQRIYWKEQWRKHQERSGYETARRSMKKSGVKSIAEIAREAREHGMDYGNYVVWLERNSV